MEIHFHCPSCLQRVSASLEQAGESFPCPGCKKPLTVPRTPTNPYARPIGVLFSQLRSIEWGFPFVPQLIQFLVVLLVVVLLCALFCTVGILSQIGGIMLTLIFDATQRFREGSTVEKSAHAITMGIYALIFLPFFIAYLPFTILGWVWATMRFYGLFFIAVALGGGFVLYRLHPEYFSLSWLFSQ